MADKIAPFRLGVSTYGWPRSVGDADARRRDRRHTYSEDGEIPLDLVRRHVGLVGVPLLPLVADQELDHVVPERLAEDLRMVCELDRLVQVRREGADPGGEPLVLGHLVDVVRRLRRQLELL